MIASCQHGDTRVDGRGSKGGEGGRCSYARVYGCRSGEELGAWRTTSPGGTHYPRGAGVATVGGVPSLPHLSMPLSALSTELTGEQRELALQAAGITSPRPQGRLGDRLPPGITQNGNQRPRSSPPRGRSPPQASQSADLLPNRPNKPRPRSARSARGSRVPKPLQTNKRRAERDERYGYTERGSPRYRSYTIHLRSTLSRNLPGVMARGIWRPTLRASDATMSQHVEGGSKTASTAGGSCRVRYS